MSAPGSENRVTIATEAPEAGPTQLWAALVSWGLGAAVVLAGIGWLGYRDATDIHARDFDPLPLFFGALFGLLGVFYLFRAVLHTLRYRKYGSSALDFGEVRLGQTFKGVLRTERDLPPAAELTARLRCDLHTVSRSVRGGGTTATACLWEASWAIPAATVSAAGIPIEIAIPANGVASGTRKSHSGASERVAWVLEVKAPLRGMDYYAKFPVKVKAHMPGGGDIAALEASTPAADAAGHEPLAGRGRSRSQSSRLLSLPFLVLGAFLTVAGAFTTWQQIRLTQNGVRAAGRVTAVSKSVIDVVIDGFGPAPVAVHVLYGSNFHTWTPGMAVQVICREVKEGTRSCRMETGLERWINTAGTLGVGAVLLLLAWFLRSL